MTQSLYTDWYFGKEPRKRAIMLNTGDSLLVVKSQWSVEREATI